jgi:hypothetical protein
LGLSWTDAVSVVLSAIGVYLAFLILIRIVGQRALAAMSSFDFAATIAVGAIMGRAVLGYTPTLGAGVLGMATLFALQSAFGKVRWNRRLDRTLSKFRCCWWPTVPCCPTTYARSRSPKVRYANSCAWQAFTVTTTSPR